ncbi:uncharacterized protein LOC143856403 [Tasmannia lanceolata]|uniref:uncharacterized protein LOC143856403 n=1 Tax=Tasmannia lanceolata TaxID=3420 RepID=UPI00406371B8
MPKQNKDDAWDIVMEKWAFGDSHMGWVIANIGRKWREWRCTLKTSYFDEDLPPPLDRITESHYRFLCDHWSTRASKDICIQNKANRALQMIKHTGGTKSNAVYWKEELQIQSKPRRYTLAVTWTRSQNFVIGCSLNINFHS